MIPHRGLKTKWETTLVLTDGRVNKRVPISYRGVAVGRETLLKTLLLEGVEVRV